jgi:hypothetical protein
MEEKDFRELQAKLNEGVQAKFNEMKNETQAKITDAIAKASEGKMSAADFEEFKKEELKSLTEKASRLEDAIQKQGEIINGLKQEKPAEAGLTIEQIIESNIGKLRELKDAGTGFIKIGLKAATMGYVPKLTSIGNSVASMDAPPTSPYAPGIGGGALTLYDIVRNPNFVTNYVNMGRTNQSRLAWINELAYAGSPAIVTEGGAKPLTGHTFKVEFSTAKKAAAYIQLTDEFDVDLPQLSTSVKRMLQNDVLRFFDDYIQADVIANATQITSTSFNSGALAGFKNQVYDATFWDALLVMGTNVRLNNFIPNVSLLNPVLWGKMQMGKDTVGRYNYPSQDFQNSLNPRQGNKIFGDNAIVGDLNQFNVDIYEDFTLKMGWINDDLIHNQFTIVGEIRFHDYISTARRTAIMYGNAKYIAETINGGTGAISGS